MTEPPPPRFQILALSGGGFRGLYTAKILADLKDEIERPIAQCFDLITGTSIGGILALAIAMEIPAREFVELFTRHGEQIFKRRWSLMGICRAPFSAKPLQNLLRAQTLFGCRLLGACKHPVIVPSRGRYYSGTSMPMQPRPATRSSRREVSVAPSSPAILPRSHRCLKTVDPNHHRLERFPVLKAPSQRRFLGCHAFTPYAVSAPAQACALATDMIIAWLQGDPSPRFRTRCVEEADVRAVKNQNITKLKECPACGRQ